MIVRIQALFVYAHKGHTIQLLLSLKDGFTQVDNMDKIRDFSAFPSFQIKKKKIKLIFLQRIERWVVLCLLVIDCVHDVKVTICVLVEEANHVTGQYFLCPISSLLCVIVYKKNI